MITPASLVTPPGLTFKSQGRPNNDSFDAKFSFVPPFRIHDLTAFVLPL